MSGSHGDGGGSNRGANRPHPGMNRSNSAVNRPLPAVNRSRRGTNRPNSHVNRPHLGANRSRLGGNRSRGGIHRPPGGVNHPRRNGHGSRRGGDRSARGADGSLFVLSRLRRHQDGSRALGQRFRHDGALAAVEAGPAGAVSPQSRTRCLVAFNNLLPYCPDYSPYGHPGLPAGKASYLFFVLRGRLGSLHAR